MSIIRIEGYEIETKDITKIVEAFDSLEDIENLTIDDFELTDYNPHDKIKAELFSGLKK